MKHILSVMTIGVCLQDPPQTDTVGHDTLMLGKSPIKWRQRPDMAIAVDWDVKHQFNQTNKIYCIITLLFCSYSESTKF